MRTSNAELLAEIDGLAQMSGVETDELEVVKHINKLESNQVQQAFFIVANKCMTLYFSKKDSAEEFLSKQSATSGMRIICTCFCDID